MKKISKFLMAFVLFFMSFMIKVDAASISISASSTKVTVGSTVKITGKASSIAGKFSVSSSNSSVLSGGGNTFLDNSSASYTFKANKAGKATITLKAIDAADYNEKTFTGSKSVTITVVNKSSGNSSSKSNTTSKNNNSKSHADNKNLSSDNTLKSLTVSLGKLSPEFKKDTTEYQAEVENNVEKMKISATANDKEATIKGLGEKKLSVGKNSFGIVVVAENGKTKTYTVVIHRKEENPIYVTVDNNKYQVVRNFKDITIPKNFKETKIIIEGKEVPALYDEITKFTLVALKDENNNTNLYLCDVDKNTYTLYQEELFQQERLLLLDMPKKMVPSKYKKYAQMINGNEYDVYKLSKKSDYALVYALNLDTGKKNLYLYDSEENTMQRYTTEYSDIASDRYDKLFYITLGLCGAIVLFIILLLIVLMKKGKQKKTTRKQK